MVNFLDFITIGNRNSPQQLNIVQKVPPTLISTQPNRENLFTPPKPYVPPAQPVYQKIVTQNEPSQNYSPFKTETTRQYMSKSSWDRQNRMNPSGPAGKYYNFGQDPSGYYVESTKTINPFQSSNTAKVFSGHNTSPITSRGNSQYTPLTNYNPFTTTPQQHTILFRKRKQLQNKKMRPITTKRKVIMKKTPVKKVQNNFKNLGKGLF